MQKKETGVDFIGNKKYDFNRQTNKPAIPRIETEHPIKQNEKSERGLYRLI